MPTDDATRNGKSLLETLKKYTTEIPKNAKNERIVQPLTIIIVAFLSRPLMAQKGSLWARLSAAPRRCSMYRMCSLGQQSVLKAQNQKKRAEGSFQHHHGNTTEQHSSHAWCVMFILCVRISQKCQSAVMAAQIRTVDR